MIRNLLRHFSSYNKRTHVPKILKDPKFSRQGILGRKKHLAVEHDVSGPYVKKAHLFFSQAKRDAMEEEYLSAKEAIRDRKLEALGLREEERLEIVLSDPVLLQRADSKVVNLVVRLAGSGPAGESRTQVIRKVLRHLGKQMYQLSLEEVAQVSRLQKEFNGEDQETWQCIRQAVRRVAVSCIYHNQASAQEKTALRGLEKEIPSSIEMAEVLKHPVFLA